MPPSDKRKCFKPRGHRRATEENLELVREGLGCFKSLGMDLSRIAKGSWERWCTDNDIPAWEGLRTTYQTLLKVNDGDLMDMKLPGKFRTTYIQGEVAAGKQSKITDFAERLRNYRELRSKWCLGFSGRLPLPREPEIARFGFE